MVASPVSLRCVGSGDAFGSGGRLQSCYHLSFDSGQLLLDCGSTSLVGMQRYGIYPNEIDAIVVSHLHGDHFGGIPYLLLEGKYVSKRSSPLTILGPKGLQKQVDATTEALYPGLLGKKLPFKVNYREFCTKTIEQIGGANVECFKVNHGVGKKAYGVRVEFGGKVVSYTGDTQWTDSLVPLAQGSDLFICECFAYNISVPSHLDYNTLLKHRDSLASKRIVLTHMGDQMLHNLENVEFDTFSDGDVIEI